VPLIVGDHRVGILSLSFPPGGRFDEDTQSRFVQALADALAQAMQRAQSMDQAAAAAERLAFLADASVALTASLDFERTVEAVTGLLVPRLADWCTLVLLEDDQLVTVGVAHTDPAKVRWARELVRAYPSRIDAPYGDGAVLRTGRSELHTDMPDELLVAAATDAEHLRLLREVGMRSGWPCRCPGAAASSACSRCSTARSPAGATPRPTSPTSRTSPGAPHSHSRRRGSCASSPGASPTRRRSRGHAAGHPGQDRPPRHCRDGGRPVLRRALPACRREG
jgi:hypothetical protein